jgi:hypothetical protein
MVSTRSSDTRLPNVSQTGLGFARSGAVCIWGVRFQKRPFSERLALWKHIPHMCDSNFLRWEHLYREKGAKSAWFEEVKGADFASYRADFSRYRANLAPQQRELDIIKGHYNEASCFEDGPRNGLGTLNAPGRLQGQSWRPGPVNHVSDEGDPLLPHHSAPGTPLMGMDVASPSLAPPNHQCAPWQ